MIKRTIEISREPAYLSVQLDQLLLKRDGQVVGQVPCEDLGVVMVDHPATTYSHGALTALAESGAVLVVCGRDHLPLGVLLPLADHSQVVWRLTEQLAVPKPVGKRLWQQLIQAKILAQARNLAEGSLPRRQLAALARAVRSGDPANVEARAARLYWNAWLVNVPDDRQAEERFRRDPDGAPPNALLNYGYAVLRAAVARALVAAGLLPAIGLHHCHRANSFCLADDLLEPLRPLVDAQARQLYWAGQTELDQPTKAALLNLLTLEVRTGEEKGPLLVALHRLVASLVRCFQGVQKRLEIPVACT